MTLPTILHAARLAVVCAAAGLALALPAQAGMILPGYRALDAAKDAGRSLSIAQRLGESATNPGVLPPDANPLGASYGEWGARWWTWILTTPVATNPLLDPTGAMCAVGQSGPVWFLAGTAGGPGARSCSIPTGKAVFFPIVNVEFDYPCPPEFGFEPAPGQTVEEMLVEFAALFAESVTELEVEVDGVALGNLFDYRAASGVFTVTADPSMVAFDPCITGTPQRIASDGYWIMLAPLSPGHHTLHFRGRGEFFGFPFETETTYDLTVVPGGRFRGGRTAGTLEGTDATTWGLVKQIFR